MPTAHSPQSTASHGPRKDAVRIAAMFDSIAGRYDFLNHLLSAGLDRRWRKRAIAALHLTGTETVLDVCTGTADLALAALEPSRRASFGPWTLRPFRGTRASGSSRAQSRDDRLRTPRFCASSRRAEAFGEGGRAPRACRGAARVLGVDFAAAMLQIGKEKVRGAGLESSIALVRGDATRLPVRDASVHAVTIAFGIRNVEQPAVACGEMARVLRPGGTLVILEFSTPRAPILRSFYLWYFRHALPLIGRLISKHPSAYSYLPASVGAFPPPEEFARQLRAAGFGDVRCVPLSFGIVYMFVAKKE